MNTKISAIATSVYALVTVMPEYSRSFLHPTASEGNRRGADTGNGTQHHSLVYSEVKTLLTIEASGISGAASPLFQKSKQASLYFNLGPVEIH